MKITQKELELIGNYTPSEGVIGSEGICFTDEMIIDFAKQYHQEQVGKIKHDGVRICLVCKTKLESTSENKMYCPNIKCKKDFQ